jgi:hypothetical protein
MAPAPLDPRPTLPARPKSGQCWRCGNGCRKEKHPYGWVCHFCADVLDCYYLVMIGLRGGTVESAFREDVAAGVVPKETILRARQAPPVQR